MSYAVGRPLTRLTLTGELNDLVDPGPVVEHIHRLLGVGMTQCMIARAAGVTERTLGNTLGDRWVQTRRGVADAILKVDGKPHKQQAHVLSTGTRRRLEGLAVLGWSLRRIADELGCDRANLAKMRKRQSVTFEMHEAVKAVFDRLGPDGGCTRTKLWAASNGFVHPLLWDDIDDPFAEPLKLGRDTGPQLVDDVVVQRLVSGRVTDATIAERRAAFARLDAQGLSCQQIASILRITERTIDRYRAQTRAA
ncbi:hypothetical protein C1M55_28310 [Rhodococcus qingshengii]|uniref:helix-turn-helix domain-containing protein n=1 Tax=Rhodococcus qingshengii TaxID=334542 RepID=UPI000C9FA263|nr:helix-turn-helix domain-containing protein [Rhodococcus qingshengii]AUS34635.1 hypothetical protein C1M55_28310 [Rhodococcus qingshengii]